MDIVTLQGRYVLADGSTPATGVVTITLSNALQDAYGTTIAVPREITKPLVDGAFSVQLVATTSPGITPAGATYQISERLGANGIRTYSIELPHDAPGATVDLATAAPVADSTITYGVTLAAFDAFKAQTTNVHGIADTGALETTTGAQTKANAAQSAAIAAAATDATTKADAAQAAAETTAATALSSHNATTTNVHGIADVVYLKRVSRVSVAAANALSKHYQMADFKCDGNNDAATINAALSEMAARRGTVELSYDTFALEDTIYLDNAITLAGQGYEQTTLRVKDGANLDAALKSRDADILATNGPWKVADGNQFGIRLVSFRLDGNKENQTAGSGHGIRIVAKGCFFDDLVIWAPRGRGLWLESAPAIAGPFPTIDDANQSSIGRMYVFNAGYHAVHFKRLGDAVVGNLTVGGNGGRGFWLENASVDLLYGHLWNNQMEGLRADGQLRCGHLQTESNAMAGLVMTVADSYVGTLFTQVNSNTQPQHVVMEAPNCVIGDAVLWRGSGAGPAVHIKADGCRFSGVLNGGTHNTHIQLGSSGAPVSNCVVDASVTATAGRILSIESGGTGNVVDVTANASGTATHWDGRNGQTDSVRYVSGAGRSQGNGEATITAAATSVVVTHGLIRTPGLSEIQITPLNSLGTAAKFWVSDPTASTFTINVDAPPGASEAKFSWRAVLGYQAAPVISGANDTFTDADGTNLTAHTADSGQAWTVHSGAFAIQGNRAQPSTTTTTQIATLDSGLSDGTFKLTANLGIDPGGTTGNHNVSLVYRYQDDNNYYFARLYWDNINDTTLISLHKRVAGAFSQIITTVPAGAINADNVIEVVVSGDSHTLKLSDATIGSATSNSLPNATRVGILAGANTYSPSTWSADTLLAQV